MQLGSVEQNRLFVVEQYEARPCSAAEHRREGAQGNHLGGVTETIEIRMNILFRW